MGGASARLGTVLGPPLITFDEYARKYGQVGTLRNDLRSFFSLKRRAGSGAAVTEDEFK